MAHDGEGTIYVPFEDYYKLLCEHAPGLKHAESLVGPPRMMEGELVVDYAFSTGECHPSSWATPPKVKEQLDLEKKMPAVECQAAMVEIAEMCSMSPQDPEKILGQLRELLDLAKDESESAKLREAFAHLISMYEGGSGFLDSWIEEYKETFGLGKSDG